MVVAFRSNSDMGKISAEVVDSNNGFAFDIFKEINHEEGSQSIFISPISISTALSMVYEGSGTTTRDVMGNTLKYKSIDPETLNSSYKNLLLYLNSVDNKVSLNIRNSIWIRQGEEIKEEFLNTNKEVFDTGVSQLDFSKSDEKTLQHALHIGGKGAKYYLLHAVETAGALVLGADIHDYETSSDRLNLEKYVDH